ncbi:MAG: preprotein translocase subunit SecG [Bryobacteraceae bacterium]|nr:preprotein translocase subunit SecG [Bryobacteraceae bacterium]
MIILLTIVHVLVCTLLIGVVLLQSGKAADLAGAFGGMGSQTTFGPRGAATLLTKATTIGAGLFMVTSLSLAVLQTREGGGRGSVLDRAPIAAPKTPTKAPSVTIPTAPVVPAPGAAPKVEVTPVPQNAVPVKTAPAPPAAVPAKK